MSKQKCHGCGKRIAGESINCGLCFKFFHPGCVKKYLSYKSVSTCCKTELRDNTVQTLSDSAVDMVEPNGSGRSEVDRGKNTADKLLHQILDKLDKTDGKLTTFIAEQTAVNADIREKLSKIPELSLKVDNHDGRILGLEQKVDELSAQVGDVSGLRNIEQRGDALSNVELIISGIPSEVADSPYQIAARVFEVLGIPELLGDVLKTREIVKNSGVSTNRVSVDESSNSHDGAPENLRADRPKIKSIILTLKSTPVREFILEKKRAKRDLTVGEVFESDQLGKIFINEVLPSTMYDLLTRTKSKAKVAAFKYVWVRDGRILARRTDGSQIIRILNDADLAKLS